MVAAAGSAARGGADTQASVTRATGAELVGSITCQTGQFGEGHGTRDTTVGGCRAEPQPGRAGAAVRKGV